MEKQDKKDHIKEEMQELDEQVDTEEEEESMEGDFDPEESIKLIKQLSEEVETLKDKLLRQMAESENVRSRSAKMIEEARDYALFAFSKDLVPVIDNLSRALEHLPDNLDDSTKNIISGVEMTKSELESAFKKHSLESILPQPGDKFDYHSHHAISQVVTKDYKAGTIVNTMQPGYKIKDRLIRPAAVAVAKDG